MVLAEKLDNNGWIFISELLEWWRTFNYWVVNGLLARPYSHRRWKACSADIQSIKHLPSPYQWCFQKVSLLLLTVFRDIVSVLQESVKSTTAIRILNESPEERTGVGTLFKQYYNTVGSKNFSIWSAVKWKYRFKTNVANGNPILN